jgi:hypothetical protein
VSKAQSALNRRQGKVAQIHPLKDRPELTELIRKSVAAFDAMTPEQKREHRAAQRKSYVVGEFMMAHPEVTREYAERIYNEVC